LNRLWRDHWGAVIAVVFLLGLGITWLLSTEMVRITGAVMGATYQISVAVPRWRSEEALRREVRERMAEIACKIDEADPLSDLSRLNHNPNLGMADSELMAWRSQVMTLSTQSGRAYDPTMGPIRALWGIGTPQAMAPLRSQIRIETLKIGTQSISLLEVKDGIVADEIARVLSRHGYHRYFIEIGDAIVVGDPRPGRLTWQIGVGLPAIGSETEEQIGVVNLSGMALGVCVKNRDVLTVDDQIWSWVIDGRVMAPIPSDSGVTVVIAPTALQAEGMAYALTVLGPEGGRVLLKRFPRIRALWMGRSNDGTLETVFANGFERQFKRRS